MRRFSKAERIAAALVQDADPAGMEADHIKPVASGGETSVENCQLLSREANRKKGSTFMEPRKWQKRFFRRWEQREAGEPFLLVAIPGGGKTFASLSVVRNWIAAGTDRRTLIVVPTDNLKSQWQEEALAFGLELQTKEFGTNFKDGFQGGVVTYQAVSKNHYLFKKLCSVAPTIAVFDEIHHCGDEESFGLGIKEGFSPAREKLLLSGTPWKTCGKSIPFVTYDGEGFSVAHFRYDYPDALQDDVVRYLMFSHATGKIEYDITGEIEFLTNDIDDDSAADRLRKLLWDTDGEFVSEQIRHAHNKLVECRKQIPDAAAMAACIDKVHAQKVAATIKAVTGCTPSVIVSDGDVATDTIRNFRSSSTEWLVCVRQVSEGTDIKRLQVLCYLTNWVTELFFRQLIGRVSRVRDMDDFEGYVYLPADPRLVRFSQNIENAQVQALRSLSEREVGELCESEQQSLFSETYSTFHSGMELVLIGNKQYPPDVAERIELLARQVGIPNVKVAATLEGYGIDIQAQQTAPKEHKTATLEETITTLRRKCQKAAFVLSKLRQCEPSEIHIKFKRQREMTEVELRQKLEILGRWIKEAKNESH